MSIKRPEYIPAPGPVFIYDGKPVSAESVFFPTEENIFNFLALFGKSIIVWRWDKVPPSDLHPEGWSLSFAIPPLDRSKIIPAIDGHCLKHGKVGPIPFVDKCPLCIQEEGIKNACGFDIPVKFEEKK